MQIKDYQNALKEVLSEIAKDIKHHEEMRMLTKGIRIRPFDKNELSLSEKRDLFISNAKALIINIFFSKTKNK